MSSISHAENKSLWVVRELGLPAVVRTCVSCRTNRHHLTINSGQRLDWTGTWELETDLPFYEVEKEPEPLDVFVRFEIPAPIRAGKLLTEGFGLSRSAAKRLVDAGRIHLPMALDARVRADFRLRIQSSGPNNQAPGPSGSSEK